MLNAAAPLWARGSGCSHGNSIARSPTTGQAPADTGSRNAAAGRSEEDPAEFAREPVNTGSIVRRLPCQDVGVDRLAHIFGREIGLQYLRRLFRPPRHAESRREVMPHLGRRIRSAG